MKNKYRWMPSTLCWLTLFFLGPDTQAEDHAPLSSWASWRAVNGNTVIPADDYPVSWSADKNVAWKIDLPDSGNSTPIVVGNRIFVTQSISDTKTRGIICYDNESGKKLWQRFVAQELDETTHKTNPYCSPSPAVHGDTVVAWLGTSGVFAYSLDGKELWRKDLGPVEHVFGYGSSPVIYNGTCYLNFGPGQHTFLVALDLKTGQERWRTPVVVDEERYGGNIEGTYATPVFAPNSDGDIELITTFPGYVVSLDAATGKEKWRCGGLDYNVHGSPAVHDGVVVALGGYKFQSIAVRMGGSGNVTKTHRLWQLKKLNSICTPVFAGDYFYRIGGNFASCHETRSGKEMWKARFSERECWSSPTRVGDLIYIVDKAGITTVFKANPEKFDVVSTNPSEDVMTNGSLAFANKAVYMRTHKSLWKFAKLDSRR